MMNGSKKIKLSSLISLLEHNSQKMNFQHNMCFQIRNWSIAIAIGTLTIAWSSNIFSDKELNIGFSFFIHIFSILILSILYKRDKAWYNYFIVFRERVKYLENLIMDNMHKSEVDFEEPEFNAFTKKYYALLPKESVFINESEIISYNSEYDKIIRNLISLMIISFIINIVYVCFVVK